MKEKEWSPIGRRHDWIKKNYGDIIFEIKIFDRGMKLDRFIFNEKTNFKKILEIIRLKYGIDYR